MRTHYFYFVCAGFIGGVIFRSFVYSRFAFAAATILFSCLFLLGGKRKYPFIAFLIVCSFGLGMLRYDFKDEDPLKHSLDAFVGSKINVEGIVMTDPESRDDAVRFVLHSKADILVKASPYPALLYGDRLVLRGTLLAPQNFKDDKGALFDYVSYLAKDDVHYLMNMPEIRVLAHDEGNPVKGALYGLKNSFMRRIETVISPPYSSLMGGLLLGAKQSLGKDLQDDFRRAGLVHVVVLSGYNITIIADFMMKLFSFLPRNYGASAGIAGIILFAVMTGGEATVVRATIMALLVIGAKLTRRTYDVTRALCIAGLVMVLHNPKIVVYDPSFQLSFMATLGLIYLAPIVEPGLGWVTERFKMREIMTTTIATQIAVLPLLLYKMGELSVVGIPVNLLVLGFIPATMFFGFVTGLAGIASASLAWITGSLTYLLLWYEIGVVKFFASLPFASVSISYFPWWAAIGVYFLYGGIYWYARPSSQALPNPSQKLGI